MPKPLKKALRRPTDINQLARFIVDRTTDGDPPAAPTRDEISRVMAALGHKGGKVGGKRRLVTMTFEERSAIGLKAAKARWAKRQSSPAKNKRKPL